MQVKKKEVPFKIQTLCFLNMRLKQSWYFLSIVIYPKHDWLPKYATHALKDHELEI